MMNLDWVDINGTIVDQDKLTQDLKTLKSGNVDGINVDVWWGIVEQTPGVYKWDPYLTLVQLAQSIGLHVCPRMVRVASSRWKCHGRDGEGCC